MALPLEELLFHLPKHDRLPFLRLPQADREALRSSIVESNRLPRTKEDLSLAPGTVSGSALGRTREVVRGRVEVIPIGG